ncbi:DNA repair protein RadA [Candidatus Uhrbacteria bacterium]|nr:DNA repair protein RadA [Candidatus Uhrbacteria bacterium]
MSKTATILFTCTTCDAQHPKWLGQCVTCGAWGTLVQGSAVPARETPRVRPEDIPTLASITATETQHIPTGISEFDIALGGGIVPGGVLLLAGEPGIGKSTLILQIAAAVAANAKRTPGVLPNKMTPGVLFREVLYATGEETAAQLRGRAERLGITTDRIRVLATSDGNMVAGALRSLRPSLAIVDSIQTLTIPDLPMDVGGVAQIRTLTSILVTTAKATGVPVIIIGHVTKDGDIAGPKMLEHLVDQVAILEGDATSDLRILRTAKNRFGPTDVAGVFAMSERGMEPCADPAAAFLGPSRHATPGSAVTVTMQGNRALLVEIQALVTRSSFGQPQRRAVGIDLNRLHVLLAVLAKHGRIPLASSDVHIATVGGFRIADPVADLAIMHALATAALDCTLPLDACIGEVGLDGTVRSIRTAERRVQEAVRLGRTRIAAPPGVPRVRGATITEIPSIHTLTTMITAARTTAT